VLRSVDTMVAVLTSTCNIYTRLWCVYEMYVARKLGVNVMLCPYGGDLGEYGDELENNICIGNISEKVDSVLARCGHPNKPINEDERTIRHVINQSLRSFEAVDEAVELIRLQYLLNYPTETIIYEKKVGHNILQRAITEAINNIPNIKNLLGFDTFLNRELTLRPNFKKVLENWNSEEDWVGKEIGDHDYYLVNEEDDSEKIDIYKRWIDTLKEALFNSNDSQ